ncbi:hypothetical protein LOD99_7675 [Oopsacas minuta]|uniref:FYVE-type domain-containing protein n=1 Tax=Oopsacas minuta TaxID=111878 RepID=A0AAV7JP11_9METZ|nr:hypothetical protein LOD99_7675 [Oopsacas minuta]
MAQTDQTLRYTKHGWKMIREGERGVFDLDEPEWIDDNKFDRCQTCNSNFSLFVRRHHCRRCGKLLCGKCCHSKVELWRMGFMDPQLVCNTCVSISQVEKELYSVADMFSKGALLMIEENDRSFGHVSKFYFDINTGVIEYENKPMSISTASDITCRMTKDPISGKSILFSLSFRAIHDVDEVKLKLSVSAPEVENKKESMDWLSGLRLAFSILGKTVAISS